MITQEQADKITRAMAMLRQAHDLLTEVWAEALGTDDEPDITEMAGTVNDCIDDCEQIQTDIPCPE